MADLTCKNLARLNKEVPVSGFLEEDLETDRYMTGRFLIAMPGMMDDRFQRTVIYMCAHGPDGAMGLVINKPLDSITFPDLLEQLKIPVPPRAKVLMSCSVAPLKRVVDLFCTHPITCMMPPWWLMTMLR